MRNRCSADGAPLAKSWAFFQQVRRTEVACRTRFILTCINKRALEELVGPWTAHAIIGKPYDLERHDLERLVVAVRQALDEPAPA